MKGLITMTINNKQNSTIGKFLFLIMMAMMLSSFAAMPVYADTDMERGKMSSTVPDPGIGLWRDVRQRDGSIVGSTQVQGVDAGVLINIGGEKWRQFRVEQIIPYSAYLLAATLIALVAFRLIRGQVQIEAGRSEKKLLRFTLNQRTIHWIVAILFVILGLTGIILLLGRTFLIPVIGNSAFATIMAIGKTIHNYLGPVFSIALLFMLVSFIKGNFYKLADVNWFLKGGGMLGKHASAGRYNAGEKSWFWMAMIGGAAIVVSGLVLNFPIFGFSRQTMELHLNIHAIASIIVVAAAFGHIYMGTIAMEGALESMTTGYCDSNWAKEHHDEWYQEVKDTVDVAAVKSDDTNKISMTDPLT